jgi:hypothetical protein
MRTQVTCFYSSGYEATVTVSCDGAQRSAPYTCPTPPRLPSRCLLWDEADKTWSQDRCKTLTSTNSTLTRCSCDRLGIFSVVADTLTSLSFKILALDIRETEPAEQRSWGLLIAVATLYGSLVLGLIATRLRRIRGSFSYMRLVSFACNMDDVQGMLNMSFDSLLDSTSLAGGSRKAACFGRPNRPSSARRKVPRLPARTTRVRMARTTVVASVRPSPV